MTPHEAPFVSRGGQKLDAALRAWRLQPTAWVCADFGSHAGGFVDCLLKHGAAKVYAVDPGYGVLDYRLRRDPRVVVCERTNAMHFAAPEACDLVTIDVGWTPQRLILPAARRALRADGRVVSLVKPQYEASPEELSGGVVIETRLDDVLARCAADVQALGWRVAETLESPIRGHGGNREFLWLLTSPDASDDASH